MVIFHSYVKLPEGIPHGGQPKQKTWAKKERKKKTTPRGSRRVEIVSVAPLGQLKTALVKYSNP